MRIDAQLNPATYNPRSSSAPPRIQRAISRAFIFGPTDLVRNTVGHSIQHGIIIGRLSGILDLTRFSRVHGRRSGGLDGATAGALLQRIARRKASGAGGEAGRVLGFSRCGSVVLGSWSGAIRDCAVYPSLSPAVVSKPPDSVWTAAGRTGESRAHLVTGQPTNKRLATEMTLHNNYRDCRS